MLDHFCTIICSNFSSTFWSNFEPHYVLQLYNICAIFCINYMNCKCVRLNRWPVRGEWWPGSDPRKWRSFARWGNGPHLHYLHPDNQLAVYLHQNYSQHTHSPYHPYNHWQSSSLLTVWEKHPNSKLKGLAVGQWEFGWTRHELWCWGELLCAFVCCREVRQGLCKKENKSGHQTPSKYQERK